MSELSYTNFILPFSTATKADIARLVSELERVNDEQTTAEIREKVGSVAPSNPMLSEQLTEFLAQNKLTYDSAEARREIIEQARLLKQHAPAIHMTFAVSADRESVQRIVQWLRETIHSQAVVSIGLQPALIAGASVRTPNRVHDFSMRSALKKQHGALVGELGALRGNN